MLLQGQLSSALSLVRRWILAVGGIAILSCVGCEPAQWGGKEYDLLRDHRSELERLGQMVSSWQWFEFVRINCFDYRVRGRVAKDKYAYIAVSGPFGDDRPLWAQPYDSLVDRREGVSLARLLDSSGVPRDSFAVLCSFMEEHDLRVVMSMNKPQAVLFFVDNWEGIGYRPVANSELYGSYPDSMLVIDEHWFWFVTDPF